MGPTTTKFLTTRELARLWMVSEATVKRWADAGLLRASRTAGGHRRFLPAEVARFQAERGLGGAATAPLKPARALGRRRARRGVSATEFLDAVSGGEDEEAAALLLEAYLDGVEMWRLFDETVALAMRRLGDLWHGGRVTVAEEHQATRAAERAVGRVGASVRRREGLGLNALCCAAEGELHALASHCLEVFLESEGWRVLGLGGNTPFFTLADAIARRRPHLVCVSSTMMLDLERSAREYERVIEAAREAGTRVALGGDGFRDPAVRRRFRADFHGTNFGELARFIGGQRWAAGKA